jgi:hypothetical protein
MVHAWTAGGNLGTARYALAGAGTTNCSFSFWWCRTTPGATGATEEYNGAAWTGVGILWLQQEDF